MSKKVLVSLDMNKNEVQNVVMQSLATAPTSPKEGQYYYNSADGKAYQYVRTSASGVTPATYAWKPLGGAEITVDSVLSATSSNPVQNQVVNAALDEKANVGEAVKMNSLYTNQTSYGIGIIYENVDNSDTNSIEILGATDSAYGVVKLDASVTQNGNNPVTGKGIYDYVGGAIAALPKEQFLDLTKTTFVQSFAWSSKSYPGSTNPSLEGKPVLVLALKNSSDNTVAYSFLNMYELVDTYTADGPIKVTGRKITHMDSTVEPGDKAIDNEVNPSFGGSFAVPGFTVDSKGHLSNVALNMVNIPDDTATTNAAGLMSAADKSKLDATLKLKKAELAIDPSNTSATVQLTVTSPKIIAVEAMYYDDLSGDVFESVLVDWECDGPTFKASIAQAETQLSIWIYVLYI